MSFIHWPEIEGFHNVRKLLQVYPELARGLSRVPYRAKVKLHGTNAAVQVRGKTVIAQSRERIITPGDDNKGFALWVSENEEIFRAKQAEEQLGDFIVFGEWCGPGIAKSVAINQAPRKVFAVFSAAMLPVTDETPLIFNPDLLAKMVPAHPDIFVLPWYGEILDIPVTGSAEDVQPYLDGINAEVAAVEACDPWVKATFGVEGIGEGLVYYPVAHAGRHDFSNLVFKAKGEKHKIISKAAPAQIDPAVAASIDEFVSMVLTDARLEQGVREAACGELRFDKKLLGPFLAWVNKDVAKETVAELEASGLEWNQVKKAVSDKARTWYVAKFETL